MEKERIKDLLPEARLDLDEGQVQDLLGPIQEDIERAEGLKDLDLEDVKPLVRLYSHSLDLRDDEAEKGMDREKALSYAYESEYGYFRLKKVVD